MKKSFFCDPACRTNWKKLFIEIRRFGRREKVFFLKSGVPDDMKKSFY
jgi:hypothetical protein